ncbi:MAG TPA: hypothetical protein VKE24_14485 [Candidatus Acidoferrales bacterium]|nr:hypothetical protein [Candidatus Acidoferrales bacterium]
MNCVVCVAALSAVLASPPLGDGPLALGMPASSSPPLLDGSITSVLRRNWGVLHSWGGWNVTPWLRLRVESNGGAHAEGALEVSFIPCHTAVRPALTLERGSGWSVLAGRQRANKITDISGPNRSFTYYYDAAYLGAEMTTRWFDVSLNLGVNRAQMSGSNFQTALQGSFSPDAGQIGPAGRLAFLVRL